MSETSTVRNYTWVTEPPITWVDWEDVPVRVAAFQQNVAAWGDVGGDSEIARRNNAHVGGAGFIGGLIVKQLTRARPVFEYAMDGVPIALLQIDLEGGVIEIKNVATHPGAEEAGGIMVEFTLNRIEFYNGRGLRLEEGMVYLETYNDDSTAAYLAMGFNQGSRREMLLDAGKSGKWTKVGAQWRMTSKVVTERLKYASIS